MCVGGEYGIDAYYIAKLIAGEAETCPESFMRSIRDILYLKKKRVIIICYFIMNFHFQKQK